MAGHTEDALGRSSIAKILNPPLAVPASEATGTICLLSGKNGEILNLVAARAAAIRAAVAYKRSITEQEQVRV